MRSIFLIFALLIPSVCHTQVVVVPEGWKTHVPDGFFIGGVIHGDSDSFKNDQYRAVAQRDFNAITSTAYLPWTVWPDSSKQPDFSKFNAVVDWGQQRGIKVHGHALLYPDANKSADWFQKIPNETVEQTLSFYITALAQQRAGQIWVWDVVNEVMANDDEVMDRDGLRSQYKEYQAMGPGYVDKAFHWAAAADPNAKLIINTTGCETMNNKSNRLYAYVQKLIGRGVPVHGVGFQTHFVDVTSAAPDIESMRRNFDRFAKLGLEIYITEMDVCAIRTRDPHPRQPGISTPNQQQLERQKLFYVQVLKLALSQPACKGFLLWDFADDYSWLHKTDRQIYNVPKDTYTYPTPFWCGKHCPIAPKPAYDGILQLLRLSEKLHR